MLTNFTGDVNVTLNTNADNALTLVGIDWGDRNNAHLRFACQKSAYNTLDALLCDVCAWIVADEPSTADIYFHLSRLRERVDVPQGGPHA